MAVREITRITVEGHGYDLCLQELGIGLVKECRRETGMGPLALVGLFRDKNADIDTLAAFVWLARRQAGEGVTLAHVESTMTYGTTVDFEVVAESTGDENPEA